MCQKKICLCVNVKQHVQRLNERLKLTDAIVKANRLGQQVKQKLYHDKTSKEPNFNIGDKVLMTKENVKIGLSKKLTPKFQGPYEIIDIGPNYTYQLKSIADGKISKSLINANRLKKYFDGESITKDDTSNEEQEPDLANNDENVLQQEPDKILQYRYQNGKKYYKVRYTGIDGSYNIWVYEHMVPQNLKTEYHNMYTNRNRKRKKLQVYKRQ